MKFHPRAARLEGESAFEVLARARALEAQGRDIVHLEIGQPDFPTPRHVRDAAKRALDEGHTGYGPSPGLPALRRAIAAHAGKIRGLDIPAERVIVGPGAKPFLFYTINALVGAGDEVIHPDPGFPMYRSLISHAGATPVSLPLREERGFRFDPEEFVSLVTDRTRLIILNSPHNPTGGVLDRGDLETVARIAIERDLIVLSDEVYLHFSYDRSFQSIASLPGMAERTVVVDGFSKSYSMTGWRLGFAIVPDDLVHAFDLYNVNIVSCAVTFNQFGALAAIEGPQDDLHSMVAEFRRRRDRLTEWLEALPGIRCHRPGGAFYAFANIRESGLGSKEFARRLLDEAGVAVLAGESFGPEGAGFIRLSYATSMERLEEAVNRMRGFLERIG